MLGKLFRSWFNRDKATDTVEQSMTAPAPGATFLHSYSPYGDFLHCTKCKVTQRTPLVHWTLLPSCCPNCGASGARHQLTWRGGRWKTTAQYPSLSTNPHRLTPIPKYTYTFEALTE